MIRKNKIGHRFFQTLLIIPVLAGMISLSAMPARAAQDDNSAGLFSGAYLYQMCRSDTKGREGVKGGHTACQAYIAGVVDYHKLMKSLGTQPLMDICVPSTVSMKRLQDIVWVFLAKNPQHGEFMASPAVTMAVYEYYPCANSSATKKKPRKKYK